MAGENLMSEYRKKIYKRYTSFIQDAKPFFDEAAARRWGGAYVTFLRGWLPERKDASILEVGCGWGRLLYFFKTRDYTNLQGVDISPDQVEVARQVIESVTEGDAIEYLDSHPNSFDLIVGLDIIEHFRKEEVLHFLEACFKALQPRGRLILQTPNSEAPWGISIRYGDFTHESSFAPNCLERLLELCGFCKIELRQAGPVVHGILSFGRYLLWKAIHIGLLLWNLAETGSKGSGIYTRVFLIKGKKI